MGRLRSSETVSSVGKETTSLQEGGLPERYKKQGKNGRKPSAARNDSATKLTVQAERCKRAANWQENPLVCLSTAQRHAPCTTPVCSMPVCSSARDSSHSASSSRFRVRKLSTPYLRQYQQGSRLYLSRASRAAAAATLAATAPATFAATASATAATGATAATLAASLGTAAEYNVVCGAAAAVQHEARTLAC